jgi:hypothetical protein
MTMFATLAAKRVARGLLYATALLPLPVLAQAAPAVRAVTIEMDRALPLRLLGVKVSPADERLVVTGRISRALRQGVLAATPLRLELRAADGSVKGLAARTLSAVDLPRCNVRDLPFRLAIDYPAPAAEDALVLVLNPRGDDRGAIYSVTCSRKPTTTASSTVSSVPGSMMYCTSGWMASHGNGVTR